MYLGWMKMIIWLKMMERDNDPDPEDAVEDIEDMGDRDKRDE